MGFNTLIWTTIQFALKIPVLTFQVKFNQIPVIGFCYESYEQMDGLTDMISPLLFSVCAEWK